MKMEIAEIMKIIKRQTLKTHPPPSLPTTEELCTLCIQYVFAYTFQLEQVLERGLSTILKMY